MFAGKVSKQASGMWHVACGMWQVQRRKGAVHSNLPTCETITAHLQCPNDDNNSNCNGNGNCNNSSRNNNHKQSQATNKRKQAINSKLQMQHRATPLLATRHTTHTLTRTHTYKHTPRDYGSYFAVVVADTCQQQSSM